MFTLKSEQIPFNLTARAGKVVIIRCLCAIQEGKECQVYRLRLKSLACLRHKTLLSDCDADRK